MRTWLVLAGLLAVGVSSRPALTAGGGGAHVVSGYRVSDVRYAVAGTRIDAVSFALDGSAAKVRARLAPDAEWSDCTLEGERFTCKTTISARASEALEVVASG